MAVSNEALLALQALRERVDQKRDEVTGMWKKPPPLVMLAYGAVVLTSGVLFSALGQWSALRGFVWGSGLSAVLGLTYGRKSLQVLPGSDRKISDVIKAVMEAVGLGEENREELENLYLQLLQWNVIENVNLELSEDLREELADLLRVPGDDQGRSQAMKEFLAKVEIDAYKAKKLLEGAVEKSLLTVATVFGQRGYPGAVEKVEEMTV